MSDSRCQIPNVRLRISDDGFTTQDFSLILKISCQKSEFSLECSHFRSNNSDVSSNVLIKNYKKILILRMPILPHFASECLSKLESDLELSSLKWPNYDSNLIKDKECNIVRQINGKKRGLLKMPIDTNENEIEKNVIQNSNIKKYLEDKPIKKRIYIKNKIINLIV